MQNTVCNHLRAHLASKLWGGVEDSVTWKKVTQKWNILTGDVTKWCHKKRAAPVPRIANRTEFSPQNCNIMRNSEQNLRSNRDPSTVTTITVIQPSLLNWNLIDLDEGNQRGFNSILLYLSFQCLFINMTSGIQRVLPK